MVKWSSVHEDLSVIPRMHIEKKKRKETGVAIYAEIPVLWRQRQEDHSGLLASQTSHLFDEFQAKERLCLKTKK